MKVKTIQAHYYESVYYLPKMTYICDVKHGTTVVSRGICEELAMPKRADKVAKKENKQEPKVALTKKRTPKRRKK